MAFPPSNQPGNQFFHYRSMFNGTLITLIISILGGALLGIAFYFTNLSEETLPWLSYLLLFIGIFCGGAVAAKKAGNRGLYHGLGVGIFYFLFLLLLALFFLPSHIAFIPLILKLLTSLIGGALGGILGIGLSQ